MGWKVLRIRWKECLLDKDQFRTIIYNFIENSEIIPFEKRYKSKKELEIEQRQDYSKRKRISNTEINCRLEIIKSYMPFSYGWIKKCTTETGLTHRQIEKICIENNINFRTTKHSGVAQK